MLTDDLLSFFTSKTQNNHWMHTFSPKGPFGNGLNGDHIQIYSVWKQRSPDKVVYNVQLHIHQNYPENAQLYGFTELFISIVYVACKWGW